MLTRKATSAGKTSGASAAALSVLLGASMPGPAQPAADVADALFRSDGRALLPFQGVPAQAGGPTADTAGRIHVAGLSAPADTSRSDLLARLHYAFGSDPGRISEHTRQAERNLLVRNADALLGATVPLPLGAERRGFVYADMGALDSALRWQGLAGLHARHGVDLVGGWRHVTYHFSSGAGFDALEFDGPFLGATLAW